MRINDILTESQLQQLDEGPLGSLAKATGKAIGGVAQGVGAIAGVPGGIKRAFQKGKNAAISTIGGEEDPTAQAAPAAAQPATGGALSAFKAGLQGKTTQEPAATAPAAAPAAAAPAAPVKAQPTAQQINKAGPAGTAPAQTLQGAAKAAADKTAAATATQGAAQAGQTMYAQVKANIDKLDKKGKQRILALLQKSLAAPAAAAPTAKPAPAAVAPVAKAAPTAKPAPAAAPAGGAAIKQMSKPAAKKAAPQTASVHRSEPALSESYRSIFVQK